MKHFVFFVLSFAMGLTCLSDNGSILIFSDDFSESGVFRDSYAPHTRHIYRITKGK